MPEFRGMQDAGWNTAIEAARAYDQFVEIIKIVGAENLSRQVTIYLAAYAYVSENRGFYEIPKKMMFIAGGDGLNIFPFSNLVEKHRIAGDKILPNANRVMKDLIGHASQIGLSELSEVFRDAFDPDLRNSIAHADYIIWKDGLRLPRRNGGQPRSSSGQTLKEL